MGEELEEIVDGQIEEIQKVIEEKSEESNKKWKNYVALTCCLLAMFAAISALFAGYKADEELKDQIKNINKYSKENTISLKIEMIKSRHETLKFMEKEIPEIEFKEIEELNKKIEKSREKSLEIKEEEENFKKSHHLLALSVTIFQLSITLCGLALIIDKKFLWHISLVFSIFGLYLMYLGLTV